MDRRKEWEEEVLCAKESVRLLEEYGTPVDDHTRMILWAASWLERMEKVKEAAKEGCSD